MNKLSNIFLFAFLMGIITVAAPVQAALQGFAPTQAVMPPESGSPGVVVGGVPAWYQDINGVSVKPCLVLPNCGLSGLGDPMFNEALPLSYPGNFPSEAFYSYASAILSVGSASATVVLALEFTFIDATTGAIILAPPRPAGALGAPFQRHRLVLSYPAGVPVPTAGNFAITHPWGQTIFTFGEAKCANNAGGLKCSMTHDLPLVGVIPPIFSAALGNGIAGSQSTFLKDPLAPLGFLGSGAAAASFTGAFNGNANSITVTDPLGNTGSTSSLTLLVGQLVGLPASPAAIVFPAQKPDVVSAPVVVTVTNPSNVNSATLSAPTITGANAADFALVAGTPVDCLPGAALPPAASCTFGVTFSEPIAAAVNGAKSATITFDVTAPANMPPTVVSLSGEIDTIAPTITSTIPADNDINVPSNNAINATFSEIVTNLNTTTFTLTTGSAPVTGVTGTVAFDVPSRTATFTPSANLLTNTTYTATITTGVADIAGNALAQNFIWSFKTTAPNTIPPVVVATSPAANATDVPVNQVISATFNEALNPASVSNTTFFLSGGATGTVAYDPVTKTATLTPHAPLINNQLYTVTITAGIVSLGGFPMTADFTWSFLASGPLAMTITKPGQVEPIVYNNSYAIIWTVNLPTGTAGITLGYDTTGTSACNGTQITSRITNTNGLDAYLWNISALPEGTYYIYGSISDSGSTVCSYAAGPLIRSNANGDINNDGTVDITDALRVLHMAVGLLSPSASEMKFGDVAPLVNGKPQPDGKIGLGDVVVILRRAVGLISW